MSGARRAWLAALLAITWTVGASTALGATGEARLWVVAGMPIRERPAPGSGVLAIVAAEVELPILELRGDWMRVRYGDLEGWIWVAGTEPEEEAPAPVAAERRLAPDPGPDPVEVERVRTLMGERALERRVGPWRLLTDVGDRRVLASLDRLTTELIAAYRQRFGLDSGLEGGQATEDREVVALFAREADYRSFLGEGSTLSSLDTGGHTGEGLSALFQGDMGDDGVRSLFVHEAVHLLDRRTLGGRAPSWLEEGLAHSMALSRIDRSGAFHAEELGGGPRVVARSAGPDGQGETIVEVSGGVAAVRTVAEGLRRGSLPSLRELTAKSWSDLVDPRVREVRYSQCALFVLYLLDGEGGRWRDGFRAYLAQLARTGDGTPGRLLAALGAGWPDLEAGFATWVRRQELRQAGR